MNWFGKLKTRWGLKSVVQVFLVLAVFACTGFTVVFIKAPLIELISDGAEGQWWISVIYYLLILPVYNVLLLGYGFLFGQSAFFWNYEKKMLRKLASKLGLK